MQERARSYFLAMKYLRSYGHCFLIARRYLIPERRKRQSPTHRLIFLVYSDKRAHRPTVDSLVQIPISHG